MRRTFKFKQIDAFTKKPLEGNPAAVFYTEDLTTKEMQKIARKMNLSETAFMQKSAKADFHLRWFTPEVEVDLCGHATIASLHYLREEKLVEENSELSIFTRSGILQCKISKEKYYMQIPTTELNEYKNYRAELLDALGLKIEELDKNIPLIITENGYLYIYVKKLSTLSKMKPNFPDLLKFSSEKVPFGAVAVYSLETFDKSNFAHLRFFAPSYGIDEDPVTGSANGPLLLVLMKLGFIKDKSKIVSKTFEQGDIIGRRGRVLVKYNCEKKELYISGNAVTVIKGEIYL